MAMLFFEIASPVLFIHDQALNNFQFLGDGGSSGDNYS
jgi:hypothetical protein